MGKDKIYKRLNNEGASSIYNEPRKLVKRQTYVQCDTNKISIRKEVF